MKTLLIALLLFNIQVSADDNGEQPMARFDGHKYKIGQTVWFEVGDDYKYHGKSVNKACVPVGKVSDHLDGFYRLEGVKCNIDGARVTVRLRIEEKFIVREFIKADFEYDGLFEDGSPYPCIRFGGTWCNI